MEIDYTAYIRDFIDSHLEGNIDSLVDYDLKNLAKDVRLSWQTVRCR